MSLTYAAHAAAWSAAGFVVGRYVDVRFDLARHIRRTENAMTDPTTPRRRRWWRPTRGNLVALALVLLAFGSTGQAVWAQASDSRITECLRGYANGFADALLTRSDATAEAQAALDELMQVVGNVLATGNPGGGKTVKEAVDNYLAKREQTREAQERNPYPPPPRDICK